ncbi:MAG: efflux RND transporter periplasmic adaptor subunit [Terriglobales bacterium]
MKPLRLRLFTLVLMAVAVVLAGCNGSGKAEQMTSFSSTHPHPTLFTVPQEQMSHLQIATVTSSQIAEVLRLPGTVAYNALRTTPVIAPVGGPVIRILAMPGEQVRIGQPLLYISSPDYNTLRNGYVKAQDAFELAEKSYQRSQDLYQHHAIAQRDFEQAASVRTQAAADLRAAEQSLRILGLNPRTALAGTASSIPLLAPIAGEVVERLVAPGQLLQAGSTQCFTVSDLSTVWVLVNIFETQIGRVHVGDTVTIASDAFSGRLPGRVSYVAPGLDPTTRTLQARVVVPNPGDRLKNNMYVTVALRSAALKSMLLVPDSAVLRDSENMPFVYQMEGDRQFARRDLQVGASQDGQTQVLAGLHAGDRVVGDGSLFLQFANALQK